MASWLRKCTDIQRSERNLKIDFCIMLHNKHNNIAESTIFEIGHFALVQFKFSRRGDNYYHIHSSVSYKIHESQKNANVHITATCKVDNRIVHPRICSRDWSEYMDLCGHTRIASAGETEIFLIKANISVNIMKPGPCQCLYEDDNYSDFQLVTDDSSVSSVPVHRAIMAAHSEVFKTMLSGEWKETAKGCLEVKGVTQETLQHLKDYMYLGSLPEHEDLRPLLLVAKCYMMHRLEDACADKLAQTVKPESLLDLLKFATDNHLSELIFSILDMTSPKLVHAAREATKIQKPKLEEE